MLATCSSDGPSTRTYTVDAECRNTYLSSNRGNLLDNTTLRRLISHDGHGFSSYIHQPEKVDFHLSSDLLLG
jgi:hypothetical protein